MGWENNMANIYGNFVWWQGVVEDRVDPLMLGRCRVRILGYHTDDIKEIPTDSLPWATIMQPTTSAALSGMGTTPLGPVEGTWVIGFFRDGEDAQEPVIMGTIGGMPEEGPDPNKGFNDPDGMYPLEDYLPDPGRETADGTVVPKPAEPDTNRLATGNAIIPTYNSDCLTNDSVPRSNGEQEYGLEWKRATRQEAVPKALAGNLSSSIDNTNEKIYATNVGGTTSNLEANLDTFSIASLSITDGGSGYVTKPTVVFTGGGATTAASATAFIDEDGEVYNTVVDSVGVGYTSVPTVAFSAPPEGGTQATATVTITGEDVSGIVEDKDKDPATYADDANYYWNEPHPRYGGVKKSKTEFATTESSTYPYNHVRASEQGHVEEWDDTPGAERLHRYHCSGTFEEIQADGTRVVKILGDDYEITASDKNVLVSGACNVTVEGDCRLLTMGSLVQEVRGNYHLNVAQDMRIKVGGNMVQEIMSARKVKVEKDDDLKVGVSQVINVGVNAKKQIGKDYSVIAGGAFSTTSGANTTINADTSVFVDAILAIDLSAGTTAGLGGLITNITGTTLCNITAPAGIINILAPDINILAVAMVNVGAPLIDIIAGGVCNVAAPDLNEVSALHVVISGLYTANAGLITLN
jgi:hypothetical protein